MSDHIAENFVSLASSGPLTETLRMAMSAELCLESVLAWAVAVATSSTARHRNFQEGVYPCRQVQGLLSPMLALGAAWQSVVPTELRNVAQP